MSNFYTDVICKDRRFRSTESVRDLELLEPVTRAAVKSIIADAMDLGIDLIATETYRSVERQQDLFNRKATKLKDVGVHHYGLACDFAKVEGNKAIYSGDWTFLRDLANRYGIISGLDWGLPGVAHSFIDADHVQRVTLAQQEELFAGTWYPDSIAAVIS